MSSKFGGFAGKVLKIDLSEQKSIEYPWSDEDREMYLGGKIMAAKILCDNLDSSVKPLSSENMLVISTGPLTGTGAPASSRFNISSISPLTNLLASSNCGGSFGLFLKKAGYDALIITGKATNKTWIEISEDNVEFHDAKSLWGKTTGETQELLPTKAGMIVIGPAGENLVKYAGVFSQERTAGRAGLGAVLGYKNLKAIVAKGKQKVNISQPERAKEFNKKWISMILNHPITGSQLPKLGTAGLVSIMQARNVLATRNFKYGRFKEFENVSGEVLAEKHLIRNKGCITCPIQCGRLVEIDGKKVKGPELETIGLLGPNIENNNLEMIMRWNYELDELGMDTISTAGTIAFAMELNEKSLWDNGLEFGKIDKLSKTFQDIAYRRGIGNELAEGSMFLSRKYGGEEFAINSKGLELSAYEPRSAVGQGLGYAVSNRGGCHLNAGYMIVFEGLCMAMNPFTTRSKAEMNVFTQDIMEGISACGNCLFTSYTMLPGLLLKNPNGIMARTANSSLTLPGVGTLVNLLNRGRAGIVMENPMLLPYIKALKLTTGMKMNYKKFKEIGERGYNLERIFNVKRGLTAKDDRLPKRLTDEPIDKSNPKSKVPLDELKRGYYKIRGWTADGIPMESTLKRLKIVGEV